MNYDFGPDSLQARASPTARSDEHLARMLDVFGLQKDESLSAFCAQFSEPLDPSLPYWSRDSAGALANPNHPDAAVAFSPFQPPSTASVQLQQDGKGGILNAASPDPVAEARRAQQAREKPIVVQPVLPTGPRFDDDDLEVEVLTEDFDKNGEFAQFKEMFMGGPKGADINNAGDAHSSSHQRPTTPNDRLEVVGDDEVRSAMKFDTLVADEEGAQGNPPAAATEPNRDATATPGRRRPMRILPDDLPANPPTVVKATESSRAVDDDAEDGDVTKPFSLDDDWDYDANLVGKTQRMAELFEQ